MIYPDWMTQEDIAEFEQEMAEIDLQAQRAPIDRELEIIADAQRDEWMHKQEYNYD